MRVQVNVHVYTSTLFPQSVYVHVHVCEHIHVHVVMHVANTAGVVIHTTTVRIYVLYT